MSYNVEEALGDGAVAATWSYNVKGTPYHHPQGMISISIGFKASKKGKEYS